MYIGGKRTEPDTWSHKTTWMTTRKTDELNKGIRILREKKMDKD